MLSGIGISTHLQEGMGAKLNASSGNCVDTAEGHCRGDSPSASNFGSNEEGIDSSGVDQINMKFASPELVGKTYGVDIAWPIHHDSVSTNFPWMPHNIDRNVNAVPDNMTTMPIQPLGDRQKVYEEFMDGCRKHYGARGAMCDETERERIAMNLRQPQNMQVRYI